jgi:hypothetical protein
VSLLFRILLIAAAEDHPYDAYLAVTGYLYRDVGGQWMRKRLATWGALVAAAITLVLVVSYAPSDLKPSKAAAATVGACSTDLTWASEGASLLSFEATHLQTVQGAESTTTVTPFAYESAAVTLNGPGEYTFDFGPVAAGFAWGTNPPGAAFLAPPDFDGYVSPIGTPAPPQLVTMDGQSYFQQEVSVSAAAACTGLQLWMY